MSLSEILIAGHQSGTFQQIVRKRPDEFAGITIVDPGFKIRQDLSEGLTSHLSLSFHDVWKAGAPNPPQYEDIVKSLDWAKDKEKIVVACHAGISRSSALAVVIALQAWQDAEQAISILNPKEHSPNRRIIEIGHARFRQYRLRDHFNRWYNEKKGHK